MITALCKICNHRHALTEPHVFAPHDNPATKPDPEELTKALAFYRKHRERSRNAMRQYRQRQKVKHKTGEDKT